MRQIPNAELPSGVKGQEIHKYKEVHYGEPVVSALHVITNNMLH